MRKFTAWSPLILAPWVGCSDRPANGEDHPMATSDTSATQPTGKAARAAARWLPRGSSRPSTKWMNTGESTATSSPRPRPG